MMQALPKFQMIKKMLNISMGKKLKIKQQNLLLKIDLKLIELKMYECEVYQWTDLSEVLEVVVHLDHQAEVVGIHVTQQVVVHEMTNQETLGEAEIVEEIKVEENLPEKDAEIMKVRLLFFGIFGFAFILTNFE